MSGLLRPGMLCRSVPAGRYGSAEVVHDAPDGLTRLRAARDGQPLLASNYTRLLINGHVWMTDAEFECATNGLVVNRMHGDILIAGLGLGLILNVLLPAERVRSVAVLENNADVIKLIGPHYNSLKLTIIEADVYDWMPPKGTKYDCVYFDIWDNVPNRDNRKEISALKARYRARLRKGGWVRAWCEENIR